MEENGRDEGQETPYIMDDSSHELEKLEDLSIDGFSELSEEMKKS